MDQKVKGGWTFNRERFSDDARKVFDVAVNHRRLFVKLTNDVLRGSRFNDDEAILARLESMFTEGEFMANTGPCIDKALEDAGQSDWWYKYEKRYDDEHYNDCYICEDEDEE